MSQRRRPRKPPPQVKQEHFRLLKTFNRNQTQREGSQEVKDQIWAMCCEGAQVALIPRDEVIEAYKTFIAGESEYTGVAVNGDTTVGYVTIGITYNKRLQASHTTRVKPILKRLLRLYLRMFPTPDEFLDAMEVLCRETVSGRETTAVVKRERK